MDDKKPVKMSDLIAAQTLDKLKQEGMDDDTGLLRDMGSDYPALRLHLLGCKVGEMKVAPGTLMVTRRGSEIHLRAHKPLLGYQVLWTGKDLFSMLEIAEEELQLGTANWQPDYNQQQKEKRTWVD